MRVFADFHHLDLFYSLQLLFEKRLGWELFRPIGETWYHEGYWDVYNHPETIKQYLSTNQAQDPPNLNTFLDQTYTPQDWKDPYFLNKYYYIKDGIYYIRDLTKDTCQKAITLEQFKIMDFDLIISSIPQHITPFNKLIKLYQPKAKHIFQVGNDWGKQSDVDNFLDSVGIVQYPANTNVCFYHQEFDLEVFKYQKNTFSNIIHSYIHCMKNDLLDQLQSRLSSHIIKRYGICMDNLLYCTRDVAHAFQCSGWTWHVKSYDGYGHILHNSYACGRPVITNIQHYQKKIGGFLLEDKVTCINVNNLNIEQIVQLLSYYSQPEQHSTLCNNAFQRFQDIVSFEEEEIAIRKFLERIF